MRTSCCAATSDVILFGCRSTPRSGNMRTDSDIHNGQSAAKDYMHDITMQLLEREFLKYADC
jgi:hypothetical protein